MSHQRRGDFSARIDEIRHGLPYGGKEMKWNKVGKQALKHYLDLIDFFFDTDWLQFHMIIVERAWVDRDRHGGNLDVAHQKHLTGFLTNKVARCKKRHAGRETEFRVYADAPYAGSSYSKAHEAAEKIANNVLANMFADARPVAQVLPCNSKEHGAIQLCDVLLGATMDAWNQRATKDAKRVVAEHVAKRVGWPDLRADTKPNEPKFNVWYLCDPREKRVVETRALRVAEALPPVKRYVPARGAR